ncbi:rCG30425 [Rattus norvegicus]|uniref:RCG30425 n=1 Tax=Rattus norvegicus TaxID=10116 RepID=A6JFN0_RAT|nr:rCG30425 [Rattus norvegicus]
MGLGKCHYSFKREQKNSHHAKLKKKFM